MVLTTCPLCTHTYKQPAHPAKSSTDSHHYSGPLSLAILPFDSSCFRGRYKSISGSRRLCRKSREICRSRGYVCRSEWHAQDAQLFHARVRIACGEGRRRVASHVTSQSFARRQDPPAARRMQYRDRYLIRAIITFLSQHFCLVWHTSHGRRIVFANNTVTGEVNWDRLKIKAHSVPSRRRQVTRYIYCYRYGLQY